MILLLILAICLADASYSETFHSNQDPELALYIEQALQRNPSIKQTFGRYQASLQRLPQVSSLPDPMFGLTEYLLSPQTRVGPQTTMITLSQQFPWFGKLSDKEKIAAKEAAVVREQYEAIKSEVVRQIKLAYYNLGYFDQSITITKEDLLVLEHYETMAQARYSQGIGLQQAVIKLQAEITRDLNRLKELQTRRVDAEAVLNNLLDHPPDSPVKRTSQWTRPQVQIDLERLYNLGHDHRPEVLGALLQIEKNEKRIQLAQKNYWPDVTLGASFINVDERSDLAGILNPPEQNGQNIYSLTIGINIPIRRRKYDAGVAEATEDKVASREGYRSILNTVETSIRAIGFRIQTLDEQITLFERTLLPQGEQALRSTEAAYSTGTIGVLDLLDSERVLLEIRLGMAQLSSEYMKSLAEMERATGSPFPEANP